MFVRPRSIVAPHFGQLVVIPRIIRTGAVSLFTTSPVEPGHRATQCRNLSARGAFLERGTRWLLGRSLGRAQSCRRAQIESVATLLSACPAVASCLIGFRFHSPPPVISSIVS